MPAAHLFPRILPDCKQVCIVPASSYIRLRFACRIYCSASAEQTVVLSCDILRYKCACGTPVCTVTASSYIRLRFACRIYCSASAEQSRLPARILFGDIRLPYGTRSCKKPLQLQTSLHRSGFSHLSLRFLYLQIV